jgi:hypothetical protein
LRLYCSRGGGCHATPAVFFVLGADTTLHRYPCVELVNRAPGAGNGEGGLVRRPEVSFEHFSISRITPTASDFAVPPSSHEPSPIHPSGSRLSAHPFSAPFILPGSSSPVDFGHTSRRVAQNGICTLLCSTRPRFGAPLRRMRISTKMERLWTRSALLCFRPPVV